MRILHPVIDIKAATVDTSVRIDALLEVFRRTSGLSCDCEVFTKLFTSPFDLDSPSVILDRLNFSGIGDFMDDSFLLLVFRLRR